MKFFRLFLASLFLATSILPPAPLATTCVAQTPVRRAAPVAASVAALANLRPANGEHVELLGYYAAADGGGQRLVYRSTGRSLLGASANDGGFYFNGPGADDYYEAVDKTVYHALRWGCVGYTTDPGSGWTMSTARIQAMIDSASATRPGDLCLFPNLIFFLDGPLNFTNCHGIEFRGTGAATRRKVTNDLGTPMTATFSQTANTNTFVLRKTLANESTGVKFNGVVITAPDSLAGYAQNAIYLNDTDGLYFGELEVTGCGIHNHVNGITNREVWAIGLDSRNISSVGAVVTLNSGTFPAWAATADLNINGEIINVASRNSDTQLTLSSAPVGGNVTNLFTPVTLLRDSAAGVGYINIHDANQIHGNTQWGIRLQGNNINTVKIVNNNIRGNGAGNGVSFKEAKYSQNFDKYGGGIWLGSGVGNIISGNCLEAQATSFRGYALLGFSFLSNYSESGYTLNSNWERCRGGIIAGNWGSGVGLAAETDASHLIKLNRCSAIQTTYNAGYEYPTYAGRMRLLLEQSTDIEGPLSNAIFDPPSNWGTGVGVMISTLDDAMKYQFTKPKRTHTYDSVAPADGRWNEAVGFSGPYGDTQGVFKFTADLGSTNANFKIRNTSAMASVAGDYLCTSFWVYIPTTNTLDASSLDSYLRVLYIDSSGGLTNGGGSSTQIWQDVLRPGGWHLVRIINRVPDAGNETVTCYVYVPGNNDSIYVYAPQVALYSSYPFHPRPCIQTSAEQLFSVGNGVWSGIAVPTDGDWKLGDRVINSEPASTEASEWICTTGGGFATARANSTAYKVGDRVLADSNKIYVCVTAGTTAGASTLSGTSNGQTDGTAVFDYVSPLAVFKPGSTISLREDWQPAHLLESWEAIAA